MSLAARGVATGVGFASLLIIYRLLGIDQMASVFMKKDLKNKYDYIIGNLLAPLVSTSNGLEINRFYVLLFFIFPPYFYCISLYCTVTNDNQN